MKWHLRIEDRNAILMTHHYADLGSASETHFLCSMTNQKHYPYLGSDMSSVWNYFSACFSDIISQGKYCKNLANCQLFCQASTNLHEFFPYRKNQDFLDSLERRGRYNGEKNTSKKLFQWGVRKSVLIFFLTCHAPKIIKLRLFPFPYAGYWSTTLEE